MEGAGTISLPTWACRTAGKGSQDTCDDVGADEELETAIPGVRSEQDTGELVDFFDRLGIQDA